MARFISIDNNYTGEAEDINTQNRYVYTLNNPYKYVDRDGNVSFAEMTYGPNYYGPKSPSSSNSNKKEKKKKDKLQTSADIYKDYYKKPFNPAKYYPTPAELYCHVDGGFGSLQKITDYETYLKFYPKLRNHFICKQALTDYNNNQENIVKNINYYKKSVEKLDFVSIGLEGEQGTDSTIASPSIESSFVNSSMELSVYGEIYSTHFRILTVVLTVCVTSDVYLLDKVNVFSGILINYESKSPVTTNNNYIDTDKYNYRIYTYHFNKTYYEDSVDITMNNSISPKKVGILNFGNSRHSLTCMIIGR